MQKNTYLAIFLHVPAVDTLHLFFIHKNLLSLHAYIRTLRRAFSLFQITFSRQGCLLPSQAIWAGFCVFAFCFVLFPGLSSTESTQK